MTTGAFEDITTELKNAYPPGTFEEPINKEAPYRKSLQRVKLKMHDGIAKFPLGIASAWSVGLIADIGEFPAPRDPTRVQGEVTPELFVGSMQIGVKTKAAAKNKVGTFNDGGILPDRVEKTTEDVGKYMNRVYVGSHVARLAIVESNSGGSALVLQKPLGAYLLEKNMSIEVRDALLAGAVRGTATARLITVIDKDARTITYSGADEATIAAGDHVFVTGTYGRTVHTLPMIVGNSSDFSTFFGQSRSTYPELNAFIEDGAGGLRNLTEQLVLAAIDKPRRQVGKKINRLLSNSGQGRKFVEFIQGERRYPGPTGSAPKYTIGYDEDSLQVLAPGVNVKLEIDFDVHPRRIYGLSWETFGLYEAMPLDWIDDDSLLKMIPTDGGHKAGFLAYIGSVENQINTMPQSCFRLGNLADSLCGD
jgi:hypothetical protein